MPFRCQNFAILCLADTVCSKCIFIRSNEVINWSFARKAVDFNQQPLKTNRDNSVDNIEIAKEILIIKHFLKLDFGI